MTSVMVIDYFVRIRDLKVITTVHDNINFIFVKTTDRNDNLDKLPDMPVVTVNNIDNLPKIIKQHDVDVLHTHVDAHAARCLGLGIPIVHECHDPATAYGNIKPKKIANEKLIMPRADKIICVGKMMKDYLHSLYGVGNKCIIIHALPNAEYLPDIYHKPPEVFNHGIYQGGMGTYKNHHRFYGDIFTKLAAQGLKIDTYSTHGNIDYGISGVRSMPFISDISKLYSTISGYHFGFIGFNRRQKSLPLLNMAMPNKMFEAVAAGIPVICMNFTSMAAFVKNHGFGVVVDDNMKLPKDFQEQMQKAKHNVLHHGREWTMEEQRKKLLDLYKRW